MLGVYGLESLVYRASNLTLESFIQEYLEGEGKE
jgi:hypothetical protein